jgi:hypothetical protein
MSYICCNKIVGKINIIGTHKTVTLQHLPAALKVKRRTDEQQRRREAQAQKERKTQDQPIGPIGAKG